MGAGLCPSAEQRPPRLVAAVCLGCPGVAGVSEFGCQTAVARGARRGGPAAAGRRAPARALGLEPGQRHSALAPRGQKLVGPSLALHSIQLGCTVSICVLTSGLLPHSAAEKVIIKVVMTHCDTTTDEHRPSSQNYFKSRPDLPHPCA